MDSFYAVAALFIAFLVGFLVAFLAGRARQAKLQATLELREAHHREKLETAQATKERMDESFQAAAADALQKNNQTFLALAEQNLSRFQSQSKDDLDQRQKAVEGLVTPLKEALSLSHAQIEKLEQARHQAHGSIETQLKSLLSSEQELRSETSRLVTALRKPTVRGRWGEIQLRRVVEIAGMVAHCDFSEQTQIQTDEGSLRPDLIVKLPGGKNVVVDAKTPMQAFLDAESSEDEMGRQEHLKQHVRQIRDHIGKLGHKSYGEQFPSAPGFVVMFLPGESLFSTALEQDPSLIEHGYQHGVLLTTPTSLIALLRTVAHVWQQEQVAQSAQAVSRLGRELYDRLRIMAEHFAKVGRGLDNAVEAYNKTAGSFESRVLISARRFIDLGSGNSQELPEAIRIEKTTRNITLPEEESPPALETQQAQEEA